MRSDRAFFRAAPGILASYVEWAESGAFTVLALFAPREPGGPEQTVLRALAEHFAGFAEAVSDGPEARLHVRHWFGANGTLMAAPLRLTIDRAGRILVTDPQDGGAGRGRADRHEQGDRRRSHVEPHAPERRRTPPKE